MRCIEPILVLSLLIKQLFFLQDILEFVKYDTILGRKKAH